jgi:hypothetical protein
MEKPKDVYENLSSTNENEENNMKFFNQNLQNVSYVTEKILEYSAEMLSLNIKKDTKDDLYFLNNTQITTKTDNLQITNFNNYHQFNIFETNGLEKYGHEINKNDSFKINCEKYSIETENLINNEMYSIKDKPNVVRSFENYLTG